MKSFALGTAVAIAIIGGATGALAADRYFSDLGQTAPRSVFHDLNETAPRSAFDDLRDTAPRSIFDVTADTAPRSSDQGGSIRLDLTGE